MKESSVSETKRREDVLERLGFGGMICMECNARAPANADSCRKCGNSQLREKKLAFQDT